MKRLDWLKLSPRLVFGLVTVGVLGLGWLVVCLPQLQTAPLSQKIKGYEKSPIPDPEKLATLEKGRIDSENAIRTGLIQGIGGTVLLIGLYFTYQNLRATQRNVAIAEDKQVTDKKTAEANLKLAEAKQVTERFGKAVEMLSSGSMHTRLGGIYALERIARDSDDDYWQVMEVLTAFVREESPWTPKQATGSGTEEEKADDRVEALQSMAALPVEPSVVAEVEASHSAAPQPELSEWKQRLHKWEQRLKEREERLAKLPPLRTDIQAVMTVIGRRKHSYGEGETQRLDLSQTDLRQLQAQEANLTGVDLSGTHLEKANLRGAHLEKAYLIETHLEHAHLPHAHLEEASLLHAHLEKANLRGVDLSQVLDLTSARLDSALTDDRTKLPDYLLAAQSLPQALIAPPPPATPDSNSEPQPLQTES